MGKFMAYRLLKSKLLKLRTYSKKKKKKSKQKSDGTNKKQIAI